MYVYMRIQKILGLKRLCTAAEISALETSIDTYLIDTNRHTCQDRGRLINTRPFCSTTAMPMGVAAGKGSSSGSREGLRGLL
jgi:hypothetical protein